MSDSAWVLDLPCPLASEIASAVLPKSDRYIGLSPRAVWYTLAPPPEEHASFVAADGRPLVRLLPAGWFEHRGETGYEAIGPPGTAEGPHLARVAGLVASAALIAAHWPKGEHRAAEAVAGGLLRAEWSRDTAFRVLFSLARAARDPDPIGRGNAVGRPGAESPASGWLELSELVGPGVAKLAQRWANWPIADVVAERVRPAG